MEWVEVGGGVALLLTTFLQISPIKLNPWTALATWLGRTLNGEVLSKMGALEREVREMKDDSARREAITARVRILQFGDELLHGICHSKESFDQTLRDVTAYERYCEAHPEFENNTAVLTIERIKAIYMERLEKKDFL